MVDLARTSGNAGRAGSSRSLLRICPARAAQGTYLVKMNTTKSMLLFILIVGSAIFLVALAAILMPLLYYRFGPPDLAATVTAVAIQATEVTLSATEAAAVATQTAATPGANETPQPTQPEAGANELTW